MLGSARAAAKSTVEEYDELGTWSLHKFTASGLYSSIQFLFLPPSLPPSSCTLLCAGKRRDWKRQNGNGESESERNNADPIGPPPSMRHEFTYAVMFPLDSSPQFEMSNRRVRTAAHVVFV